MVSVYGQRYSIDSLDAEEVTQSIGYSDDLSAEALANIYKRFGGFEAFTAKKLDDTMERLRDALLGEENFPLSDHQAIFESTTKIARYSAYAFVRPYIFADFDKFKRIWASNKHAAISFSSLFNRDDDYWASNVHETLPMIHAADCRGDEPRNMLAHYHCRTPHVFHSDRNLEFEKKSKQKLEETVDPKIIAFIQDNIFECSVDLRSLYASSLFVREDHWERLVKDPKRDVLNSVAGNAFLPLELAEQIVLEHKTASLRESIAQQTTSPELLRVIWAGTKSASIRSAVEENSLFTGVE